MSPRSSSSRLCRHLKQYFLESSNSSLTSLNSFSRLETYYLCISLDLCAAYRFFSFWILALSYLVSFILSFSNCCSFLSLWMGLVLLPLAGLWSEGSWWRESWLSVEDGWRCDSVYSFINIFWYWEYSRIFIFKCHVTTRYHKSSLKRQSKSQIYCQSLPVSFLERTSEVNKKDKLI